MKLEPHLALYKKIPTWNGLKLKSKSWFCENPRIKHREILQNSGLGDDSLDMIPKDIQHSKKQNKTKQKQNRTTSEKN